MNSLLIKETQQLKQHIKAVRGKFQKDKPKQDLKNSLSQDSDIRGGVKGVSTSLRAFSTGEEHESQPLYKPDGRVSSPNYNILLS